MKTLRDLPVEPLDLLLFRGFDPVSHTIRCFERSELGRGDYSHAGLAVTRDALDLPFLEPGKIYVWESVLSAKEGFWANFSDKIPDVNENRVRFGVQLRDLELVIPGYCEAGGQVAWCRFRGERPPAAILREELAALYREFGHARFPVNLLNFCSVVFPALRTSRDRLNRAQDSLASIVNRLLHDAGNQPTVPDADHHIFCSEWVARVYKRLGVLEVPDPRLVAPMHFLTATNLFDQPVPIFPEGLDAGQVARIESQAVGVSETAPQRRARAARERFLRHYTLQERLREFVAEHTSSVSVSEDGRIAIEFGGLDSEEAGAAEGCVDLESKLDLRRARAPLGTSPQPRPLSIAILVAGTRGDVQPFIAIGQRLQRDGHRVRLATHAVFRNFVESNGLEFYPLGGDPKELIAYMVRTGGKLLPTRVDQLLEDVPKKRQMLQEIIESTWRACTEKDPGRPDGSPFTAEAIIANPPVYGHVHVAEALHVPLQMVFTMPWSPTRAFPHAMANLDFERRGTLQNYLSYGVVDALIWAGTSDLISSFREETLGLPGLRVGHGPGLLNDGLVPFCYLWSPDLVSRPGDWGDHIDVADFVFFDQAADYRPPDDLLSFLERGAPPIFVGFGSCVVEHPEELTQTICDALQRAGRRGIVSAGWGGLGAAAPPEHIHLIDECPHDWLFPRCAAVCHHGGAGTTAAGLRAGRPTIVVPFFGDQPFWAAMVERTGAGPKPVPIGELTVERLAEAFRTCDTPEVRSRADAIGSSLRSADGADLAVKSFYRHLPTTVDGIWAYLGFSLPDRERMLDGEILTRPLREGSTRRAGFALAARIDKSLERVYEACLDGAILQHNPQVISFGTLGDRDTLPVDFASAGYADGEDGEVAELLDAKPGDSFNLSQEEYDRFRLLRERFEGKESSPEAVAGVNEAVRSLLLERCVAYRRNGIDAIAPYARAGGEEIRPGKLFRVAVPPESLVALEMPELYRAMLDYPNTSLDHESRFYWIKQEIDGHPTFALAHHAHVLGAGIAVLALRRFYIGRSLDVQQLIVGLLPLDASTFAVCGHRDIATRLAGLANVYRRSRIRSRSDEAARQIVEAIRRCD